MRKLLPILIASSVFLTPLYPIYAQTTTSYETLMVPSPSGNLGVAKLKSATREAELKKKLAKFKDKVKAGRVEKISTNLNRINERRTLQMQQTLEKISEILESLRERTSRAESAGVGVAPVNEAIAETEVKWGEANSSLKLQMENDYSISVNTETTVKDDATLARDSLRADLKLVHNLIVETKQSLANAISTAMSTVKGVPNGSD